MGGVCVCECTHALTCKGENAVSGVRIILVLERKCLNFTYSHPFDNEILKKELLELSDTDLV